MFPRCHPSSAPLLGTRGAPRTPIEGWRRRSLVVPCKAPLTDLTRLFRIYNADAVARFFARPPPLPPVALKGVVEQPRDRVVVPSESHWAIRISLKCMCVRLSGSSPAIASLACRMRACPTRQDGSSGAGSNRSFLAWSLSRRVSVGPTLPPALTPSSPSSIPLGSSRASRVTDRETLRGKQGSAGTSAAT